MPLNEILGVIKGESATEYSRIGTSELKAESDVLEIKTAAESLKSHLVVQNRCNICTLKIPCKHYKNAHEMNNKS